MNNTIINCVAVGGKFGYPLHLLIILSNYFYLFLLTILNFWMLMPKQVTGPSVFLYPTEYNPRTVGVAAFRDNIAHSCADTGNNFKNND